MFYENSIPAGTGVLEMVPEKTDADTAPLFVPLQKFGLAGTFHGPLGYLTLSQTFRFSRDVVSTPVEAIYRFPLPGDAAVSEVVVTFGEEIIRTKLMERAAAEKTYDKAFEKGKKALLVTRESPDVFTLHLTGIPPDTDVTVQTTFTLLARVIPRGWEIRIPFTIGPRYTRHDEQHPAIQAQPLLTAADPGYRVSMDLWFYPAAEITTVTPPAEIVPGDGATRVKIQDAKPDRDLHLTWTMARDLPLLSVLSADDPASGHRYFLSLINPGISGSASTIPREMILVVDQSGSMQGKKWGVARNSVFALLDTLKEEDRFNICVFSDQPLWFLRNGPNTAIPERVDTAKMFVDRTSLFSSTELGVALEQAAAQHKTVGTFSRHIIVITDGQVTDEARLFRLAEIARGDTDPRRISVITIDSSPNAFLTEELARIGGGTAKFLEKNEQMQKVLEELLLCWQQPVCCNAILSANTDLDVPGYRPVSSGDLKGIDIGDIRPGMPLHLCGRMPLTGDGCTLTLTAPGTGQLATAGAVPENGNLITAAKSLFGAAKIRSLEYILLAVHDPAEIRQRVTALRYGTMAEGGRKALYPENRKNAAEKVLRELIISESLRFGIPSTLTGFVGVSDRKGIVPQVTVAVPNALPEGWNAGFASNSMIASYNSCPEILMSCSAPSEPSLQMSDYQPMKMSSRRASRYLPFSNVRRARSPAKPKAALYNSVIPYVHESNGEALLFENILVKKGKHTLLLIFGSLVDPQEVCIRIFLDDKELGTWDLDRSMQGRDEFLLEFTVPEKGLVMAVLLDPSGHVEQKEIGVKLVRGAGGSGLISC